MRVISGSVRGRRLVSLDGLQTRPTADRVKEAIFSIILPYIYNARVLDLFAGSGALGIEALSRGASDAVFVEKNSAAIKIIEKNIEITGFESRSKVLRAEFGDFLKSASEKFDIVFLDPPYKSGFYKTALELLSERHLILPGGIAILEHEYDIAVPDVPGYEVHTDRKYGKTSVAVLKKE